jgi:hypothetical protein
MCLVVPAQFPRWLTAIHRVVSVFFAAALVLIQIAPWVSSYKVIVWVGTVLVSFAVFALPHLWTAAGWLVGARTAPRGLWVRAARPAIIGVGVLAVFWAVTRAQLRDRHDGNYSGFLAISRSLFDANPLLNSREDIRRSLQLLGNGGYDGQFMYYTTFDPLMRAFTDDPAKYRAVVDAVPYRYGRIGYSALTRLIAGRRWQHYPATMIWLLLLSLGTSAFILAVWAQDAGVSPALGYLVMLVPGFWLSIETALPEPLAAVTLLASLLSVARERWLLAGVLFAIALLVRETGLVFVAAAAGLVCGCLASAVRR